MILIVGKMIFQKSVNKRISPEQYRNNNGAYNGRPQKLQRSFVPDYGEYKGGCVQSEQKDHPDQSCDLF